MEKFSKFKKENDPYTKEVVDKIKVYFPEFVKDGKFDIQSFNNLFENKDFIANEHENYGFFWNGKNKLFQIINSNSLLTLKPNYDKSIDFKNSKNIIIEGDNLEVLKLLKSSYFEKIDVIYIDPPYNTGNDFVYNDKYKMSKSDYDESIENSNIKNSDSEGRYHTNWLNMIYPRLKLAKSLLKEDGIIFISIDDNEQARLKIICDEIFGEHNFVSCFIWQKTTAPKNNTKYVSINHDYVLCYSKRKENITINLDERTEKQLNDYKNPDNDPRGPWTRIKLRAPSYSKQNDYEIEFNGKIYAQPKGFSWIISKEKMKELIDDNRIYSEGEMIRKKAFLSESKQGVTPISLLLKEKVGISQNGTEELRKLFNNENIFSYPKPTKLIKYLINLSKNKNALVLDFFAGSGTTGQAVMELNKEDNGNRNFILVQLPEKIESEKFKSITDITRERIIRSINTFGYKEKGFKYFELTSSNFVELNDEIQPSFFDSKFKKDTNDIDLLYEIILKIGLDLNENFLEINLDGCKYFVDPSKTHIFSISDYNDTNLLVKHLVNIKKDDLELTCNLYIKEELFTDDSQKINIFKEIETRLENTSVRVL